MADSEYSRLPSELLDLEGISKGELTFWSAPTGTVSLTNVAGTKTLSSVTLPDLSNVTVKAAYAMVHINAVINSYAGGNYLYGAQTIQVDTNSAGWVTAIIIAGSEIRFETATDHEHDKQFIGSVDISSKVDFNQATDFRWINARMSNNGIGCYGVLSGLRVII